VRAWKVLAADNPRMNRTRRRRAMKTKTTNTATAADFFPRTFGEDYIKMMKTTFAKTFESTVEMQELNLKIWKDMYEAGTQIQSEAYRIFDGLIDNARKGRVEYKKAVEDGFRKVEEML